MLKGHTPAKDKIDKTEFEKLCNLWCTLTEIAEFFDVSEDIFFINKSVMHYRRYRTKCAVGIRAVCN